MLHTTTAATDTATRHLPIPRYFIITAWAVPVMVLAQFSMIALVPVSGLIIASVVDKRVRNLRWWTLALAIAYSIPLAIMLVRPDPEQSLSKDMHPALLVLIVVVGAALLMRVHIRRANRFKGK